MKKNVFLKLASALLVLCLASTCAIGTTFAKYTTADSASDTARVAKWGITVSTSGTLFGKDYAAHSAGTDADSITTAISQSVATATIADNRDKNIVAPGTKNETGFQVKLSGTPEVAYDVIASNTTASLEDIWLGEGTYGVMVLQAGLNAASNVIGLYTEDAGTYTKVTAGSWVSGTDYYALTDEATVAAGDKYYPIQWKVVAAGADKVDTITATSDITDIAADIATALNNLQGDANNPLEVTYTLTWEWKFEVDDATNAKDTILGNLMAGVAVVKTTDGGNTYKAPVDGNDYNLDIYFDLFVTVNQAN